MQSHFQFFSIVWKNVPQVNSVLYILFYYYYFFLSVVEIFLLSQIFPKNMSWEEGPQISCSHRQLSPHTGET